MNHFIHQTKTIDSLQIYLHHAVHLLTTPWHTEQASMNPQNDLAHQWARIALRRFLWMISSLIIAGLLLAAHTT